jgi:hypothetical protein
LLVPRSFSVVVRLPAKPAETATSPTQWAGASPAPTDSFLLWSQPSWLTYRFLLSQAVYGTETKHQISCRYANDFTIRECVFQY